MHEVIEAPALERWIAHAGRDTVVGAVRAALDAERDRIRHGAAAAPTIHTVVQETERKLARSSRSPLEPIINATGVVLHTGLGRAPIASSAVRAMARAAAAYAPVELDLESGGRGKRSETVRALLCELTGAESATVVNNGAGALVLAVAALASGREVVVSRGELIEIGGSFRLPDILGVGSAALREVGTTNKTRLLDYRAAMNEQCAMILKIHPSNYRITGFTESAPSEALAALAREFSLPFVHDIGSGVLNEATRAALHAPDPSARASIEAGADLVLFSGDKLLGGPQAGIIVGRRPLVSCLEKHPLMRALRVDKTTLAALHATLLIHRDPSRLAELLPVAAMACASVRELRSRAERVVQRVAEQSALIRTAVIETSGWVGGGSAPVEPIPSVAVEVRVPGLAEAELASRLRLGTPGVVGRLAAGAVLLDLRTVFPESDEPLALAVIRAAGASTAARE